MKLRCLIGIHKWEYSEESIRYVRIHTTSSADHIDRMENVRYCTKCSKKQRRAFSHVIHNSDWTDWHLTKDEERDKKLNDLGI
jgi:hypothetical protein